MPGRSSLGAATARPAAPFREDAPRNLPTVPRGSGRTQAKLANVFTPPSPPPDDNDGNRSVQLPGHRADFAAAFTVRQHATDRVHNRDDLKTDNGERHHDVTGDPRS